MYRHIIDLVDSGIVVLNTEGAVVSWNGWMAERSGISEQDILGKDMIEAMPELDNSRIARAVFKALKFNSPSVLSAKLLKTSFPLFKKSISGRSRPSERLVQSIQIKPFVHDDGSHYCVISIFDISSADMREKVLRTQSGVLSTLVKDLQEKEHELRTLFENTQNGILIFDHQGTILSVNPAASTMFQPPEGAEVQLPHQHLFDLFADIEPQQLVDGISEEFMRSLLPMAGKEHEMMAQRADGTRFPVSVSANAIPHFGQPTRFFMFVRDITARKRAEEQLYRMARMDPLTGLCNRFSFSEVLANSVKRHAREQHTLSVFFIDLDRFKNVNDSLGHDAGDELLRQVGERLVECCRDSDTVSRWAGDEFVMLLPQQNQGRSSITVAEKILEAIARPFEVNSNQVYIHCSIGIAQFPDDGVEMERLIFCADQAMYQAKADGKGKFRFFTPAMNDRTLARLKTESELRLALQHNQFELYYQPQIDVAHGRLFGVEALLRWHHPERGIIYPNEFIGVAEECGLIGQIGQWVMVQAFETASRWHKREDSSLSMSINISPKQFQEGNLIYNVRNLIQSVGFPAERLVLEVTEGHFIDDAGESLNKLRTLRNLGVKIAIDDFGTGYSSLAYLRHLPVDILKIDRHFLQSAATDKTDASIVSVIIDLAHALELEVVAEGIEHLSQMDLLRMKGCDIAQGYYIGYPMCIDDLVDWYSSYKNLGCVN